MEWTKASAHVFRGVKHGASEYSLAGLEQAGQKANCKIIPRINRSSAVSPIPNPTIKCLSTEIMK
jgi:hypothetical protein